MITFGVGSVLICRDSSLVTVRCSPSKPIGLMPLFSSSVCFTVEVTAQRVMIDMRCLDGKRTVRIYRKIRPCSLFFLDAAQHIKQLLRPADSEGGITTFRRRTAWNQLLQQGAARYPRAVPPPCLRGNGRRRWTQ